MSKAILSSRVNAEPLFSKGSRSKSTPSTFMVFISFLPLFIVSTPCESKKSNKLYDVRGSNSGQANVASYSCELLLLMPVVILQVVCSRSMLVL